MLDPISPSTAQFLVNLSRVQQRFSRTQLDISSGLRIRTASDAPDQLSSLLETRLELDQSTQATVTLGRVKAEVDTGEQVLESATTLMDRAMSLGQQGANGTETADSRQSIAGEVTAVLQELVSIGNTSFDGRYIFAGDSDQQQPYSIDLTQPDPISSYKGSPATRQIMHPDGSLFAVSRSADEIFDSPDAGANVFQAVNALRTGLLNNDQAGIEGALTQLKSASTHLSGELSFYGSVQNRVADATNYANNMQVRLKASLSAMEDTDVTSAILELNQTSVQQQAALQTEAKRPRTSLFDFLG